jgi:hypothetical protein
VVEKFVPLLCEVVDLVSQLILAIVLVFSEIGELHL